MYDRLYNSIAQQNRYAYNGHVPFETGITDEILTNSVTYNFNSNYRQRQSSVWAPTTIGDSNPPLIVEPSDIYHRYIGQLPNFSGHIPGGIFRYGKTFGSDTKDAKRWLRGDLSF